MGGLVLATVGGLASPNEVKAVEFIPGEKYDTIIANSDFTYEGLRISFDGQQSRNFRIYFTKPNGSGTYLSTEEPSVGLGQTSDRYHVRATTGGNGTLDLTFFKGTKHGGFNILEDIENVRISLDQGELDIRKSKGWSMPLIHFIDTGTGPTTRDGTGSVSSGNNHVVVDGYEMEANNSAISPMRFGSTPFVVRAQQEPYEYRFERNGSLKRIRNPDFKKY